ncbi:MAG: YkvA family protein [Pseudomonadota bacterium]
MDDVKIGEILEPGTEDEQDKRENKVRDAFWPKFKRAARSIPFSQDLVAAYFCAMDPETPTRVRGILLAALAYFILPLDSLPDFIVGFGFTDDIAVLTAAFAAVSGSITDAHRAAAKKSLDDWDGKAPEDDTADAA